MIFEEKLREKKREKKDQIIKTTTSIIKLRLKYYLMSEDNTCIAEVKLEVLPLS